MEKDIYRVGIGFRLKSGANRPLHTALKYLRALEIEAPTVEVAEARATEVFQALVREANRSDDE